MEDDERDYRESEDEDFNPEGATKDDDVSSSSEDEGNEAVRKQLAKQTARKRPADEADELDSGDEATIKESRRKRRKKGQHETADSGGEGGLVKTRAQRRAQQEEQKEQQRSYKGEVTIDVDDVWSRMKSAHVGRRQHEGDVNLTTNEAAPISDAAMQNMEAQDSANGRPERPEDDYITIKQSYEFAGQTELKEVKVLKDSAEAKAYLAKNGGNALAASAPKLDMNGVMLRRPTKRASMFEPNPTGEVKGLPAHRQRLRTPSRADVLAQQARLDEEAKAKGDRAVRINTVQKSKLDWVSHVDAEGLKDELAEYDRSKQGYMSKMDFLQNVQGRRDLEERSARLQQV